MTKRQKLFDNCRDNPKSVSFDELVRLVEAVGFKHDRTNGSPMIFIHSAPSVPLVNLQRGANGMAKHYQVRQVLDVIETHRLEVH